nr:hypothetical protein StreXyl84_57850 [Streptomyces sp. Xyl84]
MPATHIIGSLCTCQVTESGPKSPASPSSVGTVAAVRMVSTSGRLTRRPWHVDGRPRAVHRPARRPHAVRGAQAVPGGMP